MNGFEEFDNSYRELTGHDGACKWQYRLFRDLEVGRFPSDIELATGLGKTSIIALWVLALGQTIRTSPFLVPRRLAYVVDRRVVVDQASEFAEQIRHRLEAASNDPSNALHRLSSDLRGAGCTRGIIETSTLRGQRTLDTRWRDDPARPAILVGTVDMIGSRLLFSAYGRVGPWGRSLEAGLIGQDCLVVLDEAHLCSPFASTLAAIERNNGNIAPFVVIRMGATLAPVVDLLARTPGLSTDRQSDVGESESRRPFRLLPDEASEQKVSDRLHARKIIELREATNTPGQQLAEWAVGRLDNEPSAAVGIVLNTVAEARRCFEHLQRRLQARELSPNNVHLVTITGSMRGWDRDELIQSSAYARFRSNRDRSIQHDRPAFLVATSCIEVGADIDCDHLGTEACAADSMIQRLGRVNRLGVRKQGSSVLIVGKADADGPSGRVFARLRRLEAAGVRLRRRKGDGERIESFECTSFELSRRLTKPASPAKALFEMRVPPPALTPAVLDDLAMTSKHPHAGARPDVGRWLHGSVDDASLYVELAWRTELDVIADANAATAFVHAFPISPREAARCPLFEAVEVVAAIRQRAKEDPGLAQRLMLVSRYGDPVAQSLGSLPTDEAELRQLLYDAMIVLPTSTGGYDGRFVDRASVGRSVVDIAEEAQPPTRARRRRLLVKSGRVSATSGPKEHAELDGELSIDAEAPKEELMAECARAASRLLGSGWRLIECAGTGEFGVLVARENRRAMEEAEADDAAVGFGSPVPLSQHLADARRKAELLCERLLSASDDLTDVRTAIGEAAGNHDLGKDRPWWQRAVGNLAKQPIAKSGNASFNHEINRGYRHEVGSVAQVQQMELSQATDPAIADLCLHLIAAHHGHARPGFPSEAAGPIRTAATLQAVEQAATRFVRLQSRYGWWGLAWLEALVKAADVLASREEENAP